MRKIKLFPFGDNYHGNRMKKVQFAKHNMIFFLYYYSYYLAEWGLYSNLLRIFEILVNTEMDVWLEETREEEGNGKERGAKKI